MANDDYIASVLVTDSIMIAPSNDVLVKTSEIKNVRKRASINEQVRWPFCLIPGTVGVLTQP